MAGEGTPLDARAARRLALACAGLVALTYGLIVLGSLVRAHGAGLACPDWPLCFGELVPRFDFRVALEWGHRVAAGTLALCFAAVAVRVLRRSRRRAARRLAVIGAVLLGAQIVLGGLTVLQLLASWTVTAHLLTGSAFAVTLLLLTMELHEEAAPRRRRAELPAGALAAVAIGAALLALQVALGGLVSSQYAGLACAEWPTCNDGIWLPSLEGVVGLQIAHRLNAYALFAALAAAAWATRARPGLRGPCAAALAAGGAQIAVGVANVRYRIPVELTGLHSALAAALVLVQALALREAVLRRAGALRRLPAGALAAAPPDASRSAGPAA